jgi:hypothetical protein
VFDGEAHSLVSNSMTKPAGSSSTMSRDETSIGPPGPNGVGDQGIRSGMFSESMAVGDATSVGETVAGGSSQATKPATTRAGSRRRATIEFPQGRT